MNRRTPLRFDRVLFYGLAIAAFGLVELVTVQLGIYQPYDQNITIIFWVIVDFGFALAISAFIPSIFVIHRRHSILKRIERMTESIDLGDHQYRQNRPAYLLADSIDRLILEVLRNTGGDFEVIPEMIATEGIHLDNSASGEYERKLFKLKLLGFLAIPNKRYKSRLYLTVRALDALNVPASLFVTNIPDDVWQHVFRMKLSIRKEEWDGVAVHMAAALELMLLKRINDARNTDKERWTEMVKRNPRLENPLGPGKQLAALRSLGYIKTSSFEDLLVGELAELRNRIHPDEGENRTAFGVEEARKIDLYLDIILQSWYGFR